MRIQLFVGEGWSPFVGRPSWPVPEVEGIDWQLSVEKLADLFAERVRDVYRDDEVEVLPFAEGDGRLVRVELDASDPASEADEALALTAEDLARGGYAPAMIVAGEIEGLLDGIISERPHSWQVAAEG